MAKAAKRGLQDEYLKIVRKLDGDPEGREAGVYYLETTDPHSMMDNHGWATNAYLLDAKQCDALDNAARVMGSIMEKVMAKYQRDRSFRELFHLDPTIEEFTLVPSGCHAAVPLSRIDLFFDQKTLDFQICGIETGGVSGMGPCADVSRVVRLTNAYHEFASKHKAVETFNPVRECALSILHTYGNWANAEVGRNHPTHPSLAIVDIENSPRAVETREFIACLRDMGCYARSTTFSELRIERVGGIKQLVDKHGPITCVWLRARADEAAAVPGDGVRTLLEATRRGRVCTVGGYRSWPCCTRSFLSVLHAKECRQLLSWEERAFIDAHIPQTHIIDASADISAFYDQDNWVLRTEDGHQSQDVIAGSNMSKAAWRNRLVKGIKRRDAVQAHIDQHPMTVVTEAGEMERNVMLGLYVFESRLTGVQVTSGTSKSFANWTDHLDIACFAVR